MKSITHITLFVLLAAFVTSPTATRAGDRYSAKEISAKIKSINESLDSIAVAILHEMSKDRRTQQMRKERQVGSSNGATSKQRKLMKQLGLDFPENISRKEASVLITEELDRIHEAGE